MRAMALSMEPLECRAGTYRFAKLVLPTPAPDYDVRGDMTK